nr:hypothetical protein [Tanacetum cinerariifolium]
EGMNGVLKNGPWFIRYVPIILKKWTPNANLLKEDPNSFPIWVKLHDISIVAFTTNGLSAMATKLGNTIMLDSYTSSMCLQSWGCMDYARALIVIRAYRKLKHEMIISIPNVEDYEDVLHMPKKQVYQAVSKKNGASSSGTKKNFEVPRHETNSTNPFDALNMIENDDELGSNRGLSNSGKKVIHEVGDLAASGSLSTTYLVARINEPESHMLDGKLVLVGDDGKPLKPCKSTLPTSSNVTFKKVDNPVKLMRIVIIKC